MEAASEHQGDPKPPKSGKRPVIVRPSSKIFQLPMGLPPPPPKIVDRIFRGYEESPIEKRDYVFIPKLFEDRLILRNGSATHFYVSAAERERRHYFACYDEEGLRLRMELDKELPPEEQVSDFINLRTCHVDLHGRISIDDFAKQHLGVKKGNRLAFVAARGVNAQTHFEIWKKETFIAGSPTAYRDHSAVNYGRPK